MMIHFAEKFPLVQKPEAQFKPFVYFPPELPSGGIIIDVSGWTKEATLPLFDKYQNWGRKIFEIGFLAF
jgi:hypothetical protein